MLIPGPACSEERWPLIFLDYTLEWSLGSKHILEAGSQCCPPWSGIWCDFVTSVTVIIQSLLLAEDISKILGD